jgi:predicted alpha/beta hydrolase family esterase
MKRAYIIHGAFGNPQENWIPWVKKQLENKGYTVIVPKFPTPEGQNLQAWMDIIDSEKENMTYDTILIGHSVGARFLLSLLPRLHQPVLKTILVSGFTHSLENNEFGIINETFIEKSVNWASVLIKSSEFYVLHGENDPYIPVSQAEEIATRLKIDPYVIENGCHLNANAGFTKFQELMDWCFRLEITNNKPKKGEPWHITAARYCIDNADRGFSATDLSRYIKEHFPHLHKEHINAFFLEEIMSPAGRKHSRYKQGLLRYSPPLDLVSKVVEFDELKEARKNAVEARWLSIVAIIISLLSVLIPFFLKK